MRLVLIGLVGTSAVFFAMHAMPGDPALAVLGDQATPATVAAFRAKWHLDEPLVRQFATWLFGILRGDPGLSMTLASGVPIATLIAQRLPNTAFIGLYAIVLAVGVSIFAGILAALKRGSVTDAATTAVAIIGLSMPDFWIGYVLIYALALGLHIFPSFGFISPTESISGALYSGFLPALAIAAPMAASFTRILRACLIDNFHRDYVRAATSFGFSKRLIFIHFVFRNALIPYVTVIGLQIRYLLGGTVVIERIFGIPGLGAMIVDATFARDFPLIEACVVTFLLGVVSVNLLSDIICGLLNPRRR